MLMSFNKKSRRSSNSKNLHLKMYCKPDNRQHLPFGLPIALVLNRSNWATVPAALYRVSLA